jgi:hypothetical protein
VSHLGTGGDSYRPGGPVHIEGAERTSTPTLPPGPLTVSRADEEADYLDAVLHESSHGACAFALGWTVHYVDARTGKTEVTPPPLQSQTLAEKDLQHAVIAASARAFMGAHSDHAFTDDRFQVRNRGHIDFEAAQRKAEKLAAEPSVKVVYDRLVTALLAGSGRLEGAELAAVLNGE